MKVTRNGLAVCAATLLVSTYAFAEPVKTEAVITAVDGNTITAKTMNGPLTVILTPTKITQTAVSPRKKRARKGPDPGLISRSMATCGARRLRRRTSSSRIVTGAQR
jgi:hypothetical protein